MSLYNLPIGQANGIMGLDAFGNGKISIPNRQFRYYNFQYPTNGVGGLQAQSWDGTNMAGVAMQSAVGVNSTHFVGIQGNGNYGQNLALMCADYYYFKRHAISTGYLYLADYETAELFARFARFGANDYRFEVKQGGVWVQK